MKNDDKIWCIFIGTIIGALISSLYYTNQNTYQQVVKKCEDKYSEKVKNDLANGKILDKKDYLDKLAKDFEACISNKNI